MDYLLRKWEFSDGPALLTAADDPRIAQYLRDIFPSPYTEQDALRYITCCRNTPDDLEYTRAIVIDGKAAGSISLLFGRDVERKNAEIGYWLAVPYWGKGIITDAISKMVRIGFADFGLHRIHAEVFAPNIASQRVLEKNGFLREGVHREAVYKNGQYLDMIVFGLLNPLEAPSH